MADTTRLEKLEALRGLLEAALWDVPPDRLPGLVKEYRATLAEIAELQAAQPSGKGTALDELGQRRRVSGRPNASNFLGPEGSAVGGR